MNRRERLESVVVVGGGLVACLAAIAFARALPRATVTLVTLPLDPAALADRLPAVGPDAMTLFGTLGLSERALIAAGAATHRVGTRLSWGAAPFAIGEGDGVSTLAGAALHQLWWAQGGSEPFAGLVPGAALAQAERFVHPAADAGPLLGRIDYALRLDATRALPLFQSVAARANVRTVAGERVGVERSEAGVAAVSIAGERLIADLYVDASGPAALLGAADADWVDWAGSLPADRLLLGSAVARPSPADAYEANADGWSARWPLATRTLTGLAYAAGVTNDARARRLAGGEAERITVAPRRQAAPFAGNVLALGDAAAAVGALGWMGLPLALAQLELALELMPAKADEPLLRAEYNHRSGLRAERVRNYAAAFYLTGERRGAFWHPLRKVTAPEELATALVQFGQRGTLPPLEEAIVTRATWQQALIGLGVRPVRRDPVALSVPTASAVAALAQLRGAVAALPGPLPAYPDYLTRMMR
jgi:tryptophan halogenase